MPAKAAGEFVMMKAVVAVSGQAETKLRHRSPSKRMPYRSLQEYGRLVPFSSVPGAIGPDPPARSQSSGATSSQASPRSTSSASRYRSSKKAAFSSKPSAIGNSSVNL
jgi:hypothetical protein